MTEVVKADVLGFCGGVRRAVRLIEAELADHGGLYTLGAIVHNADVVAALAERGARPVERLDEVPPGATVAITAHGAGEEVVAEIRERGLRLIDTTCPIVRRAQQEAARLAGEGFTVAVLGDSLHPEVRGILSWARGHGVAVTSPDVDFPARPRGVAAIAQTTQSPEAFARFAHSLDEQLAPRGQDVLAIDTTCPETDRRYRAAAALARGVDALFVVGSRESANTRRLAETCRASGVPTYAIQSAAEIQSRWLRSARRVGVTAGASTPDGAIDDVVQEIQRTRA